jgi:hypothetical protein
MLASYAGNLPTKYCCLSQQPAGNLEEAIDFSLWRA